MLAENEKTEAYKKGVDDAARKFKEWLESLPKETASDLNELFKQFAETDDVRLQAEIRQTIHEVLMPASMFVSLRDEFELSYEDAFVRRKLTSYRQGVGREIKTRREKLGLSQIQLAEKAGISQSHVCRLETGIHVPTAVTIERIAKALGTTASQLDPGFTDE
jgi:DNA-binding XRE family transcriptional regulator